MLAVHAEIVPKFEEIASLDVHALFTHLVRLLPPKHRRLDINFDLEWSIAALSTLPEALTSLEIWDCISFVNSLPIELSALLPRSLTHITFGQRSSDSHSVAYALPQLPSTLLSLDLTFTDSTPLKVLLPALPRGLTSLWLREANRDDVSDWCPEDIGIVAPTVDSVQLTSTTSLQSHRQHPDSTSSQAHSSADLGCDLPQSSQRPGCVCRAWRASFRASSELGLLHL